MVRVGTVELPRERLLDRGGDALSLAELVALILDGRGGERACEVARRVVARGEDSGAAGLIGTGAAEWRVLDGLGWAGACRLAAAGELARRSAGAGRRRGRPIRCGADVVRTIGAELRFRRKEVFVALLLDARHRLRRVEQVSEGTLNSSVVHPREVFAPALREGAAALIVAHNHPSGDPTPSAEDRDVTVRLADAGRLLGVRLLDHVVVGDPGFLSMRERGLLPERLWER